MKNIVNCNRCGQEFTWTGSEKEIYKTKGLSCPKCRREYKEMLIVKKEIALEDTIIYCMCCGNKIKVSWQTQLKVMIGEWKMPKWCSECKIYK